MMFTLIIFDNHDWHSFCQNFGIIMDLHVTEESIMCLERKHFKVIFDNFKLFIYGVEIKCTENSLFATVCVSLRQFGPGLFGC